MPACVGAGACAGEFVATRVWLVYPPKTTESPLRRDSKALVPVGSHLVTLLTVGAHAANIRHEDARLARDIGSHVPRVRARVQRHIGDLVDVLDPRVLGFAAGLDLCVLVVLEESQARRDPVDV